MHYWILTDIAGRHGCTKDKMFLEIARRGPAADGVERFGTRADAARRAASWRKRGLAVRPQKREVVCVAIRAAEGPLVFEFSSRTAATKFARDARRDLGAEVAVEA